MKKRTITRQEILRLCLVWGFPGVIICIASLLIAVNIGKDFGGSSIVECAIFLTSSILIGLLYTTLFQLFPPTSMLVDKDQNKYL